MVLVERAGFLLAQCLGRGGWVNEPWVGENGAQAKQLQLCSFCSLLRPFGVYLRYIQSDQRLSPDQQVWLRTPPHPKPLSTPFQFEILGPPLLPAPQFEAYPDLLLSALLTEVLCVVLGD